MPEIVEPAAHNHLPSGKGHDFANFCPVLRAVTVDMTVPARWLRLKRAGAAFQQGMAEQ